MDGRGVGWGGFEVRQPRRRSRGRGGPEFAGGGGRGAGRGGRMLELRYLISDGVRI